LPPSFITPATSRRTHLLHSAAINRD
jgi:hypothetical protein